MPAGRPRLPNELKRRRGTNRLDRGVPYIENVVSLPAAESMPAYPLGLEMEGQRLWQRAWQSGVIWITPLSDMTAVERACRLADDLARARASWYKTMDPGEGRVVVAFSRELGMALSALGFDPAARAKLGVAEVTAVSKMDKLRRSRGES